MAERDPLLSQLAARFAVTPGVTLALAFGSRARGTQTEASDVDLAVQGAHDTAALAAELEAGLGVEVDVVDLGADLPIALLEELLSDAQCIFEDQPSRFAEWRARTLWAVETDGPMLKAASRAWLRSIAARGL